jgi:peptide/nickel transport system permease protein
VTTRVARVAGAMLVVIVLACAVGPLLMPHDALGVTDALRLRFSAPLSLAADGRVHLAGTDAFGRDVLTRTLLAGRLSLLIGLAGAVASGALGALLGGLAGWRRGGVDAVIMAAADTLLAVPRLVLLLACAALWRPGVATLVIVLAITGWMGVARLVRAEVLGLRARPFVEAARALGARERRIFAHHVLRNAIAPALVATSLGIGNAIMLEAGLSFLGLGVQPPAPSWGNMIAAGREHLVTAPWIALVPGALVVLTVTAATLLGDWLEARVAGRAR